MSLLPPELDARATALRQALHRIPGLAHEEHLTRDRLAGALEELGLEPRVCAETGLVADIVGGEPGPTVMLRADIDGHPVFLGLAMNSDGSVRLKPQNLIHNLPLASRS